ncbi:MAG: bifunctional oligoribonuclease/PAP phosphatase NrnA [Rhodothermales bacterium]
MIDEILSLIEKHDRFFITTHTRPDGDALGSELALGLFLEKLGKDVSMLNSDPPPMNMDWLPGLDKVEVFDGSIDHRTQVDGADVVFVLDTNARDRIGKLSGPVGASGGVKVLVDHHTHPEEWFDVQCSRQTASSTGEIVYELIAAYDADLIDTDIATALYAAIMTDTGSFRYSSVTPELHRITADILERGSLSPAPIHIAVYDTRSTESLRLMGRVLETITLLYDGQLAYIVVTPRMLKETGASSEDTEGFVNYALSIDGVKAAVLFFETEGGTKMSFRSKGDAHVNEWARSFGGGGHKNASGAYLTEPLEATIDKVTAAAPRFLELDVDDDGDVTLTEEDDAYLSSLLEIKSQNP